MNDKIEINKELLEEIEDFVSHHLFYESYPDEDGYTEEYNNDDAFELIAKIRPLLEDE